MSLTALASAFVTPQSDLIYLLPKRCLLPPAALVLGASREKFEGQRRPGTSDRPLSSLPNRWYCQCEPCYRPISHVESRSLPPPLSVIFQQVAYLAQSVAYPTANPTR